MSNMLSSTSFGAVITTLIALSPFAANAASSSVTTGSFTLCQFFSSVPGVDYSDVDTSTMTLPTCPSSLLTFSYTIPPSATVAIPATLETVTVVPSATATSANFTLCQFYSSVPGLPSPTTVISSTIGVSECPSSLQHITYSYQQAPLGTTTSSHGSATTTTSHSGSVLGVSAGATFTGAAAPLRPGLERVILAGGAGGILAGAVGLML